MAFEDVLRSNASIMEAYRKMYQKDSGTQKEVIEEAKVSKEEVKQVEKELEKVVDKLDEGFGDHRDAYAMHRVHAAKHDPAHKFAIVHKMDHSKVAKTFPDRNSAVQHLDNDESLQGTHRVIGMDGVRHMAESADDEETRFNSWADSVKKAFPEKQLKFKNRIESGTHTTSAEVSGEDRSYGVWDHDKSEGHVFHESKTVEESVEAIAAEPQLHSGHYCAYGRKFATHCFPTPAAANEFMTSEKGKEYGYIGMSDDGQYHVAHMNDAGEVSSVE